MSVDNFNEILALVVKDDLTKQNTHLRESIPAEIKLAITLRYLATGNAYTLIGETFARETFANFANFGLFRESFQNGNSRKFIQ